MEKKTKIFILVLLIIASISIYLVYKRSFVTYDYEVVPILEDEFYE